MSSQNKRDIGSFVSKIFIKELLNEYEVDESIQDMYENILGQIQQKEYDLSSNVDKVLIESHVVKIIKNYDKSNLVKRRQYGFDK